MESPFLIFVLAAIYFIPSVVGWNTKYASGILILNLFLGWTILGWVGALIWAVSAPKENKKQDRIGIKQDDRWQKEFIALRDNIFMRNDQEQSIDKNFEELRKKLNLNEAIIKNKMSYEYEIVTAEHWEKILKENRQDEYEIIEEK